MKRGMLAVAALCIAAAFFLALSLGSVTLRPGWIPGARGDGADAIPSSAAIDAADVGSWVRVLLFAIGTVMIAAAALSLLTREGRRRFLVYAATAAVVYLCFVVVSVALPRQEPPQQAPADRSLREPQPVPQEIASMDAPGSPAPSWILDAAIAAGVLAAAGAAAGILAAVRARRKAAPWAEIGERARQAAHALDKGEDLGSVILRCYRDMLEVIDRGRGLRRGSAVTASEFARVLGEAGLPAGPVRELTIVFEEVRYGAAVPGAPAEARARGALAQITRFCEEAA